MVQRIADDGVVGGEQRFKHTAVGIEASGVENGVFGVEVVGDGSFKLLVNVLRAANEAHARHAVAAAVHHFLGTLDEVRVVREAKIVVGAEVEHFLSLDRDGSLLRAFDQALLLVEAGLLDVLQFLLEVSLKFTVHNKGVDLRFIVKSVCAPCDAALCWRSLQG